jgi:hypothetical protein
MHAVFDCKGAGIGFVGVTDQRLIFYDQAFLRSRKSMISIPYHQIVGVASADEGTILKTSEITLLTAAGQDTFEFRGADKAHWTYEFIMNQILNQTHPQGRGRGLEDGFGSPPLAYSELAPTLFPLPTAGSPPEGLK